MKQNVASQLISAQMVSATDGSDQTTGTCNVAVEIDGSAGTGGTATHIANGKWEYAPIQSDTNGSYLTFQFVITGALTTTVQVYTGFPQSVDNETRLAVIEADTNELQGDDVPTLISNLDAVVDTVKAETALIVADTNELQSDDVPGLIASLDAVVDTVKVDTAAILIDTAEIGAAGAGLTNIGTIATVTDVTNQVTADVTGIGGSATAAANLSASALGIVVGAATATTLTTTTMSTGLSEATDDHYIGRIIVWTSGVLLNQATDITDYTGSTKLLTFTAVTEAPSDTDTFVIV